jgi:hypothetical protein
MRAAEMLDLRDMVFVEPSFDHLTEDAYTAMFLNGPAQEARMLVDEEEWPMAMALRDGDTWRATAFLLRQPTIEVVETFERVGGEVFEESKEAFMRAVREHFSLKLMREVSPAIEDLSPDRCDKVRDLIVQMWGAREGVQCLDCGCGSGMGTLALKRLGMEPLSYDNDPALLSLGLSTGRLEPENTMWIDAALASQYCRPTPCGLSLMAGSINDFNAHMWKMIVYELLVLTEDTLATVGTEKEAELVRLWCLGKGRKVEVFENERDPFYDRWVISSSSP